MTHKKRKGKNNFGKWLSIAACLLILFNLIFKVEISFRFLKAEKTSSQNVDILPANGVTLPVKWNSMGKMMAEAGVIDDEKFSSIYASRGGLSESDQAIMNGEFDGNVVISKQNSGILLNMFWGLGLGNENRILTEGPMSDPRYGGAGGFASTGGFTLSKGDPMDHYGKHTMVVLTEDEQMLVEKVAKNIYRPCCNNSTYFPDCNHGMAMLGLLELMASQEISEEDMYKTALIVNAYWFPDTYNNIAKYLQQKGIDFGDVEAKELLSEKYSSGSGYKAVLSEVEPVKSSGGGGCSV